jgi:hypothetical protein
MNKIPVDTLYLMARTFKRVYFYIKRKGRYTKMNTVLNKVNASRVNYFAAPSFWVCDATEENYKILKANNIVFTTNSFIANNGTRVVRYEFEIDRPTATKFIVDNEVDYEILKLVKKMQPISDELWNTRFKGADPVLTGFTTRLQHELADGDTICSASFAEELATKMYGKDSRCEF